MRLRGVEELEVVALGLELPVVDRVEVDVGLAQELGLAQVEVRQIATNGLNASRTAAGGEDQGPMMNKKHEVSLSPLRDRRVCRWAHTKAGTYLGEAGGDLAPVEDSKHLLLGVVVDEGVEERLPVHFGQSVHASLLQFLCVRAARRCGAGEHQEEPGK